MAYDFRANQVRLNRIISSGSVPILIYPSSSAADFAGNLVSSFSTTAIGSDVFVYISGSSTAKTVFGGDALTSGSFRSLKGITGSIQFVDDGVLPFIDGGSGVSTFYNAYGQWIIETPKYFTSPSNGVLQTTGSILAVGLSSSNGAQITGSLEVLGGITGSISGTTSGNPFIVAGPNITANYNPLGQWEITGSAGGTGSDFFFFSRTANIIEASGSLYLSGAFRATTLSASLGAIITGSVVQGIGGTASGLYSHAEGYQTTAAGDYSHTEGNTTSTTIPGQYAHAEGISTTASGLYSHAEGTSTEAKGDASHSEGQNTIAQGDYSHAEGVDTTAAGKGSHASGWGTEAHADHQSALGAFNLKNNSTSIFVIGDGSDDSNRHDLLRAETGNVQVSGSLIVDPSYKITGSIQTVDGINPYLVGSGVTVNYNTLGQYEITGSGGSSFSLSGSVTVYGDGTNRGSGSISGLFDTTANRVGKYEVDIVAVAFNNTDGAGWKYSTTTFSGNPASFRFIGINELAEDLSGTGASGWEVNFNDSGTLDVTGSTSASGTFFYARVVNKMVANFNSIIS